MNKKKTYKEQLKIDRYALDAELIEQPQRYMEWALALAEAESELKSAENDYELIRGEQEKKIRNDPERYGFERTPTKDAISDEARRNKRVQRYYKYYLKALHEVNVLKRAERAFQQRKSMLQSLVQLNMQLYFAEPNVRMQQRDEKSRSIRDNIKGQMLRKKIKRRRK